MHSLPNILLALVLVRYVHSTCYDYWKGDSLPAFSNNSYCRKCLLIQEALFAGQSQIKSSQKIALETLKQLHTTRIYTANHIQMEKLGKNVLE
jgi:hypothetical protein